MRALICSLLVLFAAAIIAPHESIGTHESPATGVKALGKVCGHDWQKPSDQGQFGVVTIDELQFDTLMIFSHQIVWRSVRTVANSQLSPLLI